MKKLVIALTLVTERLQRELMSSLSFISLCRFPHNAQSLNSLKLIMLLMACGAHQFPHNAEEKLGSRAPGQERDTGHHSIVIV